MHHNLPLQVTDPGKAVATARALLLEAGATIQSANRQLQTGSLSATMDRPTYDALIPALEQLDGTLLYENTSTNAMGPQIRQLEENLRLCEQGKTMLTGLARRADGHELDAVLQLHALNERECTNLESQLRSQRTQAGRMYVSLSFQKLQAR